LGSGFSVGFLFQFLFEIDDFQALRSARAPRPGGGRGVHPAKSYQFFSEIEEFPGARVGGRGGARAPARENINLKKKLKGKTSHGSW